MAVTDIILVSGVGPGGSVPDIMTGGLVASGGSTGPVDPIGPFIHNTANLLERVRDLLVLILAEY